MFRAYDVNSAFLMISFYNDVVLCMLRVSPLEKSGPGLAYGWWMQGKEFTKLENARTAAVNSATGEHHFSNRKEWNYVNLKLSLKLRNREIPSRKLLAVLNGLWCWLWQKPCVEERKHLPWRIALRWAIRSSSVLLASSSFVFANKNDPTPHTFSLRMSIPDPCCYWGRR